MRLSAGTALTKKENRLVVGSRQWAESLPEWILDEIKKERMVLGLISIATSLTEAEKVGNAEAIAYLFTTSLRGPLTTNMTEIYLYLVTKVMEKRMQGQAIPADIRRTELNSYQQRELRELKLMIYHKRGGDIQIPILDALRQVFGDSKRISKKTETGQMSLFE